jgi:RNA polymerase nonessential primary-like sigma factor
MDTKQKYFLEIQGYKLLDAQEEIEVAKRARAGDPVARELLINSNLRLVVKYANKYRDRGVDLMDLIEEGNIGLITAVKKFDPEMGNRFSTYATWWIQERLENAIIKQSKTIRLPNNVYREWRKHMRQSSENNEGSNSHFDQLPTKGSSLNTPVGEGGSAEIIDMLEDDSPNAESSLSQGEFAWAVNESVCKLNSRTRSILEMRFGLNGYDEHTLEEISKEIGISRERVRQIAKKALLDLKPQISRNIGDSEFHDMTLA